MKHEFVSIQVFCDRYNITRKHLYVSKGKGSLPDYVFKKQKKVRDMLIDATFLERRLKFREKVIRSNQQFFYEMTEDRPIVRLSEAYQKFAPSRPISTISMWFATGLFRHRDFSALSYRVPPLHWQMYRLQKKIRKVMK